jgi:hypothetical protein
MLTCPAPASYAYPPRRPKQCGRSSVRPFPHYAFVGLPHRALPHRRARRAPLLPAPLTCVLVTCPACSFAVHPSPIAVERAADPTMAAGAHVLWCLRFSPIKPRAPTSMPGAGGARVLRLAAVSYPHGRNRPTWLSLPYVAYICFKCFRHFRCMLQLFHLDVTKVDRGMLHML